MKLIDKSALVAEIDRLENKLYYEPENFKDVGAKMALDSLKSSLDTLEIKEANSVWHDAIELPDETSLILLSLKDGNFILADEKTAYIRELVDKWCYVSDI